MKPRTANSLLMDFIKEQPMDAKTTTTPLFKEEHAEKTVKPKAVPLERAKFVALAQKRKNKAIKAIRLVGQLERRPRDLDPTDISVMANALDAEVDDVRNRLIAAWKGEPDFQLGGEGE